MIAYVYLLEEIPHRPGESGPWTKIGVSKNPPKWRVDANLKRGNPRDVNVAATYVFESEQAAYEAEKRAHHQFRRFAHQKEWFLVPWQQVADWLSGSGYSKL